MITPYSGQVRKLRDSLGKIFSVQLSDEDKDAVAMLDSLETGQEATSIIVGKPLTQSVRIATVCTYQELSDFLRSIISKEKKPK